MQTIAIQTRHQHISEDRQNHLAVWFSNLATMAEKNRLGITATLILIQVSIAGFNVVIPPLLGASMLLVAPGIFAAFIANAIALAQVGMKWTLFFFALSIVVNAAVILYSIIHF